MEFVSQIPVLGPILFWIVPFLLVLSIVVFIHELGHLMVGRWCGIKAEVFSIGFGKVLFGRTDKYGTKWQVAALPFGGYVKFLGDMDPSSAGHVSDEDINPDDRRHAFHNASVGSRTLTVLAGPVANFILSIVIFTGLALYVGKASLEPEIGGIGQLDPATIGFQPGDRVLSIGGQGVEDFTDVMDRLADAHGQVQDAQVIRAGEEITIQTSYDERPRILDAPVDGAAIAAGLRPGDVLVAINGQGVITVQDVSAVIIELPLDQPIVVAIDREGERREISVVPGERETEGADGAPRTVPYLGISMSRVLGLQPSTEPVTVLEATERGIAQVWKIVTDTVTYISRMLFDGATTEHLSGPIGIAKHSSLAADAGLIYYIRFIAFVSTAIGFLNLLPIPVLDGGHLVFYLIEAIRRRRVNEKIVHYGSILGFSLLILLMVFVTSFNDIPAVIGEIERSGVFSSE